MSWRWLMELPPTLISGIGVYIAVAGRSPDWMYETRMRTPRSARLVGFSYVAMGGAWAVILAEIIMGYKDEWLPLMAVAAVLFSAQVMLRLRASKHSEQ